MCLLCRRPNARDRNCRFRRRVTAESRQVFGLRCIGKRPPSQACRLSGVMAVSASLPLRVSSGFRPDSLRPARANRLFSDCTDQAERHPENQRPRRPRHTVDSAPSAAREAGCARQASSDALTHPATRLLRLRLDAVRGAVRRYAALPRGASLAAALCFRARRSTTGSPGASRPRCIARGRLRRLQLEVLGQAAG